MRRVVGRVAAGLAFAVLAVAAYLCFWPVPVEPVAWEAQAPPGYTGPYAPNTRLSGLRTIDIGDEVGPEHIAIGPDSFLDGSKQLQLLVVCQRRRLARSPSDHEAITPRI